MVVVQIVPNPLPALSSPLINHLHLQNTHVSFRNCNGQGKEMLMLLWYFPSFGISYFSEEQGVKIFLMLNNLKS